MKSNRFWLTLFAALLGLSVLGVVFVTRLAGGGTTAMVYQGGQMLYTLELDGDFEPYTLAVTGPVENIIEVEPGRIRVLSATCPDQLCVHQGWLRAGLVPVVCLPGGLVIQLQSVSAPDIDAVVQ